MEPMNLRDEAFVTETERKKEQMTSSSSHSLPVASSASQVLTTSNSVFLHPECIGPAIKKWGFLLEDDAGWPHPCHYYDGSAESVRWIFVLDTLNHCFWPDRGEATWTVLYNGNAYSGYWGLAAALKRAYGEGMPITSAEYLAGIDRADLRRILAGDGEIPLFAERLRNLREAGRAIVSLWDGDIVHLVESSGGSAVRAVWNVVSSFPSFRDEAMYKGEKVRFWKRAQLFIADVHAAFTGASLGRFADIDELTAFADYKLPQVLRELEIISYHPVLANRIDERHSIEAGCEEEVEIRAATICAVEALRAGFHRGGLPVNSVRVDNWLWRLGQIKEFRGKPYHRCRTIFY